MSNKNLEKNYSANSLLQENHGEKEGVAIIQTMGSNVPVDEQLYIAQHGSEDICLMLIKQMGLSLHFEVVNKLFKRRSTKIQEALIALMKPAAKTKLDYVDMLWIAKYGTEEEKLNVITSKYTDMFDHGLYKEFIVYGSQAVYLKLLEVFGDRLSSNEQDLLVDSRVPIVIEQMIEKLQHRLCSSSQVKIACLSCKVIDEGIKIKMMQEIGNKMDGTVQIALKKFSSRDVLIKLVGIMGNNIDPFIAKDFFEKITEDDCLKLIEFVGNKLTVQMQVACSTYGMSDSLYIKLIEIMGEQLAENAKIRLRAYASDEVRKKLELGA